MEGVNLEGLDLKGLQKLCESKGLKTYGTKKLLCARLEKHKEEKSVAPEPEETSM